MPEQNEILSTWRELPPWGKFAIIAVGGYGLYRVGKNLFKEKPPQVELPTGGSGLVAGKSDTGQTVYWNPDPVALRLYNAMKGANIIDALGGYTERFAAMMEYKDLPTDDMFVAVYNTFNEKYGEGDSLRKWINGETGLDISQVKPAVLERMNRLSLQ